MNVQIIIWLSHIAVHRLLSPVMFITGVWKSCFPYCCCCGFMFFGLCNTLYTVSTCAGREVDASRVSSLQAVTFGPFKMLETVSTFSLCVDCSCSLWLLVCVAPTFSYEASSQEEEVESAGCGCASAGWFCIIWAGGACALKTMK